MSERTRRLAMLGFRSGPGGIGRVITTLINALLARGIEIDLLLPPGEHPDLVALKGEAGIYSMDTENRREACAALREYLKERRPRAMLSNKDQTNRLLTRDMLGAQRPFTVFRIGTHVPEKLRRSSPLTAFWKRRRLAAVYREADALIAISSGAAAALQRMIRTGRASTGETPPITTIFNPVDRRAITKLAAEPLAHPWLSQPTGPVIVGVGRLVRAKNFALLLHAFALLPPDLGARLLICGEGGQHDRLLALAKDLGITGRFELLGHQVNPFRYVAAADLFVCSSLYEGANNALIEALTLGTQCVSTDCPSGPRDVLDNGRLGALVPIDDPTALAIAMQRALETPVDQERLAAGAERFNPEHSAARYAEVLGLATATGADTGTGATP